MTLWDFLNGAGFWQWVGLLMLAGIFGKCFAYAGKEEVKP